MLDGHIYSHKFYSCRPQFWQGGFLHYFILYFFRLEYLNISGKYSFEKVLNPLIAFMCLLIGCVHSLIFTYLQIHSLQNPTN
ncbi:unnamed protein product [Meloidogyne enterolobii]|uniref:Uncharacterized protein n=1 Tax=Meloidogyne enterolobii TaxID=390850 RepID=A0ACB1AMG5_MELEN